MKLSALILTKNEEEMIADCLKQLDFADEIIVLDTGSTDKTLTIAKNYTDNILESNLADFDKNRNLLKEAAKGEWLLYIDADERLTPELISEISTEIRENRSSAYYIPRKNYILGKWLKHGGWWPDYVPRLFRAKDLIAWEGRVHETPKLAGNFSHLKHPLEHRTARSISAILAKSATWAKVEADLFYKNGYPKVNSWKLAKASVREFISRYFVKMGFLDGTVGLIESIYQALHQAMVFTYLWELQNDTKGKFEKLKKQSRT